MRGLEAGGLLRSSLGRRLLALLVLAAVVPLLILAGYSVSGVSRALLKSRQAELIQASKTYGMDVTSRVEHVRSLVQATIDSGEKAQDIARALAPHMRDEISSIQVAPRNQRSPALPPDSGTTRLVTLTDDAGQTQTLLLFPLGSPSTARLLVTFDNDYLWGKADELPVMTDFSVLDRSGNRLVMTSGFPAPALPALQERLAENAHSGVMEVPSGQGDDRAHVGYWVLSSAGLGGPALLFATSQPASYVTAAVGSFRTSFIPIALISALAAALLAMIQIRRILTPIQALTHATERIGERDFSVRVPVTGDDELGRFGSAFNTMCSQIDQHFSTLSCLGEIDRIVLTTLDIDRVMSQALSGILAVSAAEHAFIIVRTHDGSEARCHALRRGEVQATRTDIDPAAAHTGSSDTAGPVVRYAIQHAGKELGVLVLPDSAGQTAPTIVEPQIQRFLDRLAVALGAADREHRLMTQARYDALTGLPNRRHLIEHLSTQIDKAMRLGHHGALLFLDLDHFKRANDALGHLAGDDLLRQVADRLRSALVSDQSLGRLGGDEFTIICPPDARPPDIDALCAQLVNLFRTPFLVHGRLLAVGVSIGSARYPADGTNVIDLLRRADTAMYRAKKEGRQNHRAFDAAMDEEVQNTLALDQAIREALARKQLHLHYQPQVSASNGRLEGAEALIRWHHPVTGIVPPLEWLPHAESSELIDEVGAWALNEACVQMIRWDEQGIHVPRIAVNVSARQLAGDRLYADVIDALHRSGLAASRLELEITESQLMADPILSVAVLQKLHAYGVKLAIDDFGTGYSSFSQLRVLPLAALKIDRSFVCDLETSGDAREVALGIIRMAHALRLEVIAEGVETEAQQAILAGMDCNWLQGYLIARPMDNAAFLAFARAHA